MALTAEELLQVASHELSNGTMVVSRLADRLRRRWEALGEAERLALVDEIVASADQLGGLLRNVRSLREDQFGGSDGAVVEPVAVGPELSRMEGALATAAEERPLALDVAAGLPPVSADRSRLQQALTNLVVNAARHSPPGAPVTVSASAAVGGVRVAVDDRGEGIPAGARELVFAKDTQLSVSAGGSGLGLFVVRALVGSMGGDVWAEEAPGGGTRMVCFLPAWAEPPQGRATA